MFSFKLSQKYIRLLSVLGCVIVYVYIIYDCLQKNIEIRSGVPSDFNYTNTKFCNVAGCIDEFIDFEGFDNNSPNLTRYIVPNIIHLIFLNKPELKFAEMVSILSMYVNHKPDWFYIHCDNCSFSSRYWLKLKKVDEFWKTVRVKRIIKLSRDIAGIEPGWIHHRTDLYRLNVLMNYGGIYLDTDMYVFKSLNQFRKYELTLSWLGEAHEMGNPIFIAHKNARLLRTFADIYRYNYTQHVWYWNAGLYPATVLSKNENAKLAHNVKIEFGTLPYYNELYKKNSSSIENNFYTIHLLINHRYYVDRSSPIKEFDDENIKNYTFTFGRLARKVLESVDYYNL